jgi:ferredoxin
MPLPARGSQGIAPFVAFPHDPQGVLLMAYVVCEPCHDCKYTDCVVVCPCDCFFQDELQLYIDPVECIDCEACVPECPVEAIFHEENVPHQWTQFVRLNAERVATLKEVGGNITTKQEAKAGPGCKGIARM